MSEQAVEKHIKALLLSQPIDIPVFHEVAIRLQQMMNDQSYRIEEAIILVHEDTSLASEMLRFANTTYNSGITPITTIKDAIVRLGSQQIVNLAFTASLANSKSDNPVINAHYKNLWRHCHTVAVASSLLAVQIGHDNTKVDINADEVYLAGLLHAIGKLYLLKSMDRLIKADLLQADNNVILEICNEYKIQQGVKVMQHWNIPKIYINAVERHTSTNWKCGVNDHLVAAVRLACKIHNFIRQEIDVSETSEEFSKVEEELTLLNIDDVAYVNNMVKTLAD
jgi:HD-like signal output (HDOD) protein